MLPKIQLKMQIIRFHPINVDGAVGPLRTSTVCRSASGLLESLLFSSNMHNPAF